MLLEVNRDVAYHSLGFDCLVHRETAFPGFDGLLWRLHYCIVYCMCALHFTVQCLRYRNTHLFLTRKTYTCTCMYMYQLQKIGYCKHCTIQLLCMCMHVNCSVIFLHEVQL